MMISSSYHFYRRLHALTLNLLLVCFTRLHILSLLFNKIKLVFVAAGKDG